MRQKVLGCVGVRGRCNRCVEERATPWQRVGARGSLDGGDLFGSGLGAADLSFGKEHGVRATLKWAKIAQIHQSGAKTPLLMVLLAERGLGGGAISSGRSCWRNWQCGRPELSSCWKERQRKRSPEGASESVKDVY
jgi:hypothetical protein